ncbi:molybdenum ABC transporter substrate binding protein precursor [Advenella kashmirensis WT001]|uniref:Molybdate-binding protein ModA n=1 Tax=Advenella kashmirensis (strain DSM 17095 / LMG 22695 / WT001) TaxID=1036672 RepID=I3UEL4_ADVKW|nr:molybdenum ABC transporter substrate binding protein precursor [Advenella kashmirensis WT001]
MEQKNIRRYRRAQALVAGLVFSFASLAAGADTLTVSAASSLTNVFKEVAAAYSKAHPDMQIQYNFAASGALLQQIRQGAPVDVFASADQKSMDDAAQGGLLDEATRKNFVRNEVVLIVPAASNGAVRDLQSLEAPAVNRIAVATLPACLSDAIPKRAWKKADSGTSSHPNSFSPKMYVRCWTMFPVAKCRQDLSMLPMPPCAATRSAWCRPCLSIPWSVILSRSSSLQPRRRKPVRSYSFLTLSRHRQFLPTPASKSPDGNQ